MPFDSHRFDPVPSWRRRATVTVVDEDGPSPAEHAGPQARAVLVGSSGPVPPELGIDRAALEGCGFGGRPGQVLLLPRPPGPLLVAVGAGDPDDLDVHALRDAAATFTSAVPGCARLAFALPEHSADVEEAALAVVEGVLLSRYEFRLRGHTTPATPVDSLHLLVRSGEVAEAEAGARWGEASAAACRLSRDLAHCPGGVLTATRMAEVATEVAAATGLSVEVFGREELQALGCGGLLGVNQGSVEPPRMVRLRYVPEDPAATAGHLTLVGKGIMYDSGGISLKPPDGVHATMKNDMSGAASVLAAMSALGELRCATAVTGYLMCTDNMPSGSAIQMGDVLTVHGGTTVEVLNTDAEGRLVMADALVLATEEPTDAIVDIATLTGACLRALGPEVAGVLGNHPGLLAQVVAAGETTDEPVWELPMVRRYRRWMDSDIADVANLGGAHAGAITAALFLEDFVAGRPWVHIDVAGTAQADAARTWRPKGPTGFGTRLLLELATGFQCPSPGAVTS